MPCDLRVNVRKIYVAYGPDRTKLWQFFIRHAGQNYIARDALKENLPDSYTV